MNLSAAYREQLRLSLLRFMDDNASPRGLGAALLLQMARSEGRPTLDQATVNLELQYLLDKKLIADVGKVISPEMATFRLTAEGRDFVATNVE